MRTFEQKQRRTALRLGYGEDVAALNAEHDPLHRALCAWLGVASYALRDAAGEHLTSAEHELARYEEAAVLAVQRFARRAGLPMPKA